MVPFPLTQLVYALSDRAPCLALSTYRDVSNRTISIEKQQQQKGISKVIAPSLRYNTIIEPKISTRSAPQVIPFFFWAVAMLFPAAEGIRVIQSIEFSPSKTHTNIQFCPFDPDILSPRNAHIHPRPNIERNTLFPPNKFNFNHNKKRPVRYSSHCRHRCTHMCSVKRQRDDGVVGVTADAQLVHLANVHTVNSR